MDNWQTTIPWTITTGLLFCPCVKMVVKTAPVRPTPEALAYLDKKMQSTVEPGWFDILVGGSSVDVQNTPLEVVPA